MTLYIYYKKKKSVSTDTPFLDLWIDMVICITAILLYYSAIKSSMMVQADLATGLPGPKIAATPAL